MKTGYKFLGSTSQVYLDTPQSFSSLILKSKSPPDALPMIINTIISLW